MACNPEILSEVPLFSLLDPEEKALLAAQVDLKSFAARQRIYRRGGPGAPPMQSSPVPSRWGA